ncbi:MAG: ATP-dependent RecD-like DNA helicase [Gammaproteobacteria bacterium]|nr:ATP-dependent RecD-like DNA helicase [Gammaproteobacteria bacterium]
MVRADLLDGVDAVLRRFRKRQQPFGGVQLLMIGDLHQLSPVIREQEWPLLAPYYDSCYFFSSNALKQTDMVSIELQRIYRQSDADFIQLLSRVRDNQLDDATLQILNSRYVPGFHPGEDEDYITLTTHNRKADNINNRQLEALESESFTFPAGIEGDYPEHAYPTAERLVLKEGAQVMFVRNDSSAEKRYFNGKIGRITRIGDEQIAVQCPGDDEEILIEPVSWENIKYTLDARTREISAEVIGRFIQFPLRLAWAITIHKSQGLTFERAIIDAEAAFSHGQVYVALSRCKTFDGIVLSSPISASVVKTDSTVSQFVNQASQQPPDEDQLRRARVLYQQQLLLDCFDYQPLASSLRNFTRKLRDHAKLIQCSGMDNLDVLEKQTIDDIIVVADKFRHQLQGLFCAGEDPGRRRAYSGTDPKGGGVFHRQTADRPALLAGRLQLRHRQQGNSPADRIKLWIP